MRRLLIMILAACWFLPLPAIANPGLALIPPVAGAVRTGFKLGPTVYAAGHRGVDLVAKVGSSVQASAGGRVHFAGVVAGRPSVSIDHGGIRTTYTPVSSSLKVGDVVKAGQVIGILLAGHCEDGCLHWGLTDGTNYFDPRRHQRDRDVRLLPHGSEPAPPEPLPLMSLGTSISPGSHPVKGRITSKFGMRVHPVTGVYKLHDGVDYGAGCGTPIHSPWAGTVVKRDFTRGYGYRVHVQHAGGLTTAYAHLPRYGVKVGQQIPAGGQVGVIGTTGYSTGCHLHWMAWQHGKLVNPSSLL